jgi:hypothetical protein
MNKIILSIHSNVNTEILLDAVAELLAKFNLTPTIVNNGNGLAFVSAVSGEPTEPHADIPVDNIDSSNDVVADPVDIALGAIELPSELNTEPTDDNQVVIPLAIAEPELGCGSDPLVPEVPRGPQSLTPVIILSLSTQSQINSFYDASQARSALYVRLLKSAPEFISFSYLGIEYNYPKIGTGISDVCNQPAIACDDCISVVLKFGDSPDRQFNCMLQIVQTDGDTSLVFGSDLTGIINQTPTTS